jgi:putative ABC transport system permease protein
VIAALGLFGLSAQSVEQRTKEIGIRKAIGASRADVLRMLLWQFARPVLWANVIAWCVAGYLMHRWLQGFVSHVDLDPLVFLGAGVAALAIALATVVSHALLVARTKPATALRYE